MTGDGGGDRGLEEPDTPAENSTLTESEMKDRFSINLD